MLTSTRKPGPPVPPRPSAAAVANALAKHREKSPSQQISGVHTLKPPHPGRTVVYKSPAFDQVKKPQSSDPKELGASKTEVYVGESHGYSNNNVPRPVLPPPATTISTNNSSSLENGKLMYTSTCSIIEINSSSSASTSASSSPVSTLQKTDSKANLLGIVGGRATDHHRNHFNSADDEEDDTSSICQKQLKNTYNHRRHQHHLLDPLDNSSSDDLIAIKRNSPDVIVINSSSEHDSGTEHNSMDTNSIASSNSLERENNLKNLESRTAHMTEIIIGSDGSDVVTNTNIVEATNHVIRSSSIRLPYRPEPEGGEHVTPSNDSKSISKTPTIDPSTLNSKLNEKKVAFHELLISELTAMRSAAANQANRRQRKPPETRSSPEISPTGTARIRTADWIEVGDNGKEVILSSCQISLEDSGLEDEGKHDEEEQDDDGGSSGVGDSWDSVKDAEERITMSLPGLPPLPKSLSGFDLAGQQLQAHQQHHNQQQHQNHHHHQQHHPPQHQPPPPPQQHQHNQQQHLQPPQQHQQQQQSPLPHSQQQQHPQGLPPSLNHHPTNPFIPIGVNLQSVSMASLVSQRGQSPVSSTVSSSSMAATPNSGSGSGGGGGTTSQQAVRKPTTLDTQLAILRREMYGLRQLDLSLLSQLWALNESIQEFRTMLQEQETLSPPSPTPSNSDANSVSSDDDEDDSSNTQTVGGAGAGGLLTNHHNLIESVAAASVLSSAAQTASSRMRAPPPPPPNRKAPSRPV